MTDIFVSYSKQDHERVRVLVAALEAHGFSVWWDRDIVTGSDFRDVIDQQIRDARCMVVVWSEHANASKWVRDEADEGVRRNMLVPVLIDRVLPPMGFRSIQSADLTRWQGDETDPVLAQLLADIAPVLKGDRAAAPATDTRVPVFESRAASGRRGRLNPKWLAVGIPVVLAAAWFVSAALRTTPVTSAPPDPTRIEDRSAAASKVPADASRAAASLPAPVPAEPPPAEYFVMPAVGRQPDTAVRLIKAQEKRNQITDDADWWVANGLSPLTYSVPNPFRQELGDLPPFVPVQYQGLRVVKAIRGTPVLAIYGENFSQGRYLLAIDPATGRSTVAVDFSLYEWPRSFNRQDKEFVQMATVWAQVEGHVLYVAHAHSTYAKSSDGFNAYVTALDVRSNRILWRSQPLVSNAGNFVISGDAIITGYGFTSEKDLLYVLNKADGRVVQRVPLASGPSNLALKDGRLHVRTYDADYMFTVTAASPTGPS